MSSRDPVQVTIDAERTGPRFVADAQDHDPAAQASAHGWKCLDLCCPDRVPKRGPTPPVCYTCGKAMALIYAPPLKAEQDLAPYVTTGVLSREEVWERARLEAHRASDAHNRMMVRYPLSVAYMEGI